MTDEELRNLPPTVSSMFIEDAKAWAQEQKALGLPTGGDSYRAFIANWQPPAGAVAAANAESDRILAEQSARFQEELANRKPNVNLENGKTDATGFPVVPGYQSGITDNPPVIGSDSTAIPTSAFEKVPAGFNSTSKDTIKKKDDPNVSGDNKRLQFIRPRSARALSANNGKDSYTSDRGPIASIKLLPGPGYDPAKAVEGARSDLSDDINALKAGRFANFFLTDVQYAFNEKIQITQTFGDNEVVYYFGRQPLMFNFSGLLFDSLENDWFSKFLTLYAGVLRGTQLAKSFSLVEITLPNMVMRGTIASLSCNQNSARDTDIPFSMQFIAKEAVPLPTIMPTGNTVNNVGTFVDFNATRKGVLGYTLGSGSIGSGFMDPISKTVGNVSGALGGALGALNAVQGAAADVGASLNSFRTNIFTPVFGVISSITKIVKSVTGTIKTIVSSLSDPVNRILGDIQSIAAKASGIALLVENTLNDVISVPARTANNVKNTIRSLKKASGTITRVPENVSETFKRLYGSGRIKHGAAVLSSGKARTKSKAAVLSSGATYVPSRSNTL